MREVRGAEFAAALAAEAGATQTCHEAAAEPGVCHLARARTLVTRCVDEPVDVSFVTVDWDDVALKVYLHEGVGLWPA